MDSIYLYNATLINEGQSKETNLLIQSGRIAAIGSSISLPPGTKEVDLAGTVLLPGMIDDQVHFREPGMEHKGSIATESRAAVAGGITSYMEMPNCNPLTINAETLANKHQRAAQSSMANYAFYLGATNNNLEDIKRIDPAMTCGIKVFMGASTGDMLVDNRDTLEAIFSSTPLLVATHCEDTPTILNNERLFIQRFGEQIPFREHPNIRSEEACYLSSSLAVELAKKHATRLHVLHLTTAKELALFSSGDTNKKRITAEACVHHLFFNDSDYEAKGALIKCNPAIKKRTDQIALQEAITTDIIDVIATDHAPHTWEEKTRKYTQAPSGLPLVQHALLMLLELVDNGTFSLEKIVEKIAHTPATLFNVKARGFIREGYWADLVVIARNRKTIVDQSEIYSKCGWSPFSGHTFSSRIEQTYVNGKLKYDRGAFPDTSPGIALEFSERD
ncbi:MAG: dihydroorotase [Pseudomonadales bacterium]|nr:dihydroorotase [Pseudomonadales bacterium]